ncbi:MAG: tetratricopeptide repeat protein [Anaerolineae bacterium]|jgi:hypothetical protein|nr:tetratricopeptide repeat protein [Anaerolineae bacterium]MDH7473900.1 tetratricopeptide repeat protein [Anaerolineae bacterium]
MKRLLFTLILVLLLAACKQEPSVGPLPTQTVTSPAALFPRTEAAQRALFEQEANMELIIDMDTALREEITAYLNAHLDPARPLTDQTTVLNALRAALPNAGDNCTLLPTDLDSDGSDELIVWNCANMPVGLLFTSGKDGYTAHPLPVTKTDTWVWPQLWFGTIQAQDVTGDSRPELFLSYVLPGGSMTTEKLNVLSWNGRDFQTCFYAELINWVGPSTWKLASNPIGGQDIVLRYPYFYPTGFEAKMISHPWAVQRWQWDPFLERYTPRETMRYPESVLSDSGAEWELLRVLVNEAELHYQAGDLERALVAYQDVVNRAASVERPQERTANWPAYARFRIAQVQAMLGQTDAARAGLKALLSDLDEDSNLRPLVQVFYDTYDPARPDADLRATAALHGLRLYEQFYWHDDRPGDLTFPMNMRTILWPGTPLARYLDAHPQAAQGSPSSEQEQALLSALSELGFPVTEVRITDLNADGLSEVLVTTDETDQPNGFRSIWLLTQTGNRWRSARQPNADGNLSEDLTEESLPDGRIVLRQGDSVFLWTGKTLVEVDPQTYEPLPPAWPRVGVPTSQSSSLPAFQPTSNLSNHRT